jgi:hypothetical protein
MTNFQKRLEIMLGNCREPIPLRFYRTFEDELFDVCGYCGSPLLDADLYYTIAKVFFEGQLREEIAVCRNCQSGMKEGYSIESLSALKSIYSETYLQRRLEILYRTGADEDRVANMLAQCSICSAPRDESTTYIEYALCMRTDLVFYTHPSMVCEKCALHIYNSLSEQTKEHKRRFMQEHFGFPPPDSSVQEEDAKKLPIWLLG